MRICIFAAFAALVGAAGAQSISSFVFVTNLAGVSSSVSGLSLTTTMGSNPSFMLGSNTFQIERVWGIWALDDDDDLTGATTTQGNWNSNINFSGTGGIVGWKTQNPNQGITANQSVTLTYSSLAGSIEDIGYHVRVIGTLPGGGNTLHIRNAPVPEPATLAALGLGVAAMIRRRRARKVLA